VENRFVAIGKIKRCIRGDHDMANIYVDADLTPAEAQVNYDLRHRRNTLNTERSDIDQTKFHYGIRNEKIIKIAH
jgi:hypothetical protein